MVLGRPAGKRVFPRNHAASPLNLPLKRLRGQATRYSQESGKGSTSHRPAKTSLLAVLNVVLHLFIRFFLFWLPSILAEKRNSVVNSFRHCVFPVPPTIG